jgi:hypothetical protein
MAAGADSVTRKRYSYARFAFLRPICRKEDAFPGHQRLLTTLAA